MPTYQYACTACAERLEVVQRFTDDPLTECPSCLGVLRKVFSPVGVVFKGSGFYKTDARRPAGSNGSGSNGSGSSSGSDGSAAAKPAGKAADKPAAGPAPSTDTPKAAAG